MDLKLTNFWDLFAEQFCQQKGYVKILKNDKIDDEST